MNCVCDAWSSAVCAPQAGCRSGPELAGMFQARGHGGGSRWASDPRGKAPAIHDMFQGAYVQRSTSCAAWGIALFLHHEQCLWASGCVAYRQGLPIRGLNRRRGRFDLLITASTTGTHCSGSYCLHRMHSQSVHLTDFTPRIATCPGGTLQWQRALPLLRSRMTTSKACASAGFNMPNHF